MESGKESVSLLVEKDYNVALQSAKHINEYNEQRKDIDKQMTEEANQNCGTPGKSEKAVEHRAV